MACITTDKDFMTLFSIPFEPKKIIFSPNSEFFQDGNTVCKLREKLLAVDIDNEDLLHISHPEFRCGESGCRVAFTNVHEYEIHYRSAHCLVCSECKKTFPNYNLLDIHIQEKHDSYFSAAKEKNRAQCSCFIEGCNEAFITSEMRNEHVIKAHNYPPNFKYQPLKTATSDHEKMDLSQEDTFKSTNSLPSGTSKSSVPRRICFGRGLQPTFMRQSKKHASSRDITMKELSDAL
ncbi:zinc finger protein 511-like [Stegodyphus dumicola]|uniref:zinc finger protein 511-like n=1 Tax=Stegodyphus dumicola TaxID=202533 RepID=UPI0015AD74B8|nr:zinc finger protein 511-like [Stegodyphus dumicola]